MECGGERDEGDDFVFHAVFAWNDDIRVCDCFDCDGIGWVLCVLIRRKMKRWELKVCIASGIFCYAVFALMAVNGCYDYYFGHVKGVYVSPALFMMVIPFFSFYSAVITVMVYDCWLELKRMNQRKRWYGHD